MIGADCRLTGARVTHRNQWHAATTKIDLDPSGGANGDDLSIANGTLQTKT